MWQLSCRAQSCLGMLTGFSHNGLRQRIPDSCLGMYNVHMYIVQQLFADSCCVMLTATGTVQETIRQLFLYSSLLLPAVEKCDKYFSDSNWRLRQLIADVVCDNCQWHDSWQPPATLNSCLPKNAAIYMAAKFSETSAALVPLYLCLQMFVESFLFHLLVLCPIWPLFTPSGGRFFCGPRIFATLYMWERRATEGKTLQLSYSEPRDTFLRFPIFYTQHDACSYISTSHTGGKEGRRKVIQKWIP